MVTPNFERRGRTILRDVHEADPALQTSAIPSTATLDKIVASQGRQRESLVFWSDVQATVTITTTSSDLSLPSVTVTGIPVGATIQRVIALFKYRALFDSSGTANELETGGSLTPAIQVRSDAPGTYTDAINLVDAQFVVGADETAPGDVLIGDNDIKAEVDEDDTYNFQIDDADAVGNNLILRDVQCGLKIEFSI